MTMRRTDLPRITLVTPSYNQAQYLEATLRSVLRQGYPRLEYIVMDGGSTDGSVAIIERHAAALAHWESGPDGGQAEAISRGFRRGSGDVLGWLNSDDLLLPGALEAVGRHFARHPGTECVAGGTVLIEADGRRREGRLGIPWFDLGEPVSYDALLVRGMKFSQPATFWTREAYDAVGGLDTTLRFCFDYDLFLRLARRGRTARLLKVLAAFRHHPASKTHTIHDVCLAEDAMLRARHAARYQRVAWRGRAYDRAGQLRHRLAQLAYLAGLVPIRAWDD